MSGKTGKRPCAYCKRWFAPNPRAGKRQKACEDPDCKRERHRRACARWRSRNPDHDAAERLRKKLDAARQQAPPPAPNVPLPKVWWKTARDAVGAKVEVVIQEVAKVLDRRARDAVTAKMGEGRATSPKVLPEVARDAFEVARAPP
jgi:hypothetical protein